MEKNVQTAPTTSLLPPTTFSGLTQPIQQLQMFPRKAVVEYPKTKNTADSLGEVDADDLFKYYIKGDAHGKAVRASEWISTHLAEIVGLSCPTPSIVERLNGDLVFGSRRISGVADDTTTAAYLTTQTASNDAIQALGLKELLSAIYAFDMCLHNDDRHLGNYLSVDDGGIRRLYTFDFSRALFWKWPWTDFPDQGQNTRMYGRILRGLHGFDMQSAIQTINRVGSINVGTVNAILGQMPSTWLDINQQQQFLQIWQDGTLSSRLDSLKKGLTDGSLL